MDEKVTIIVPVYNVEKYLERCVNSLINQTYRNLEIILVNDGSTDNSPVICDEFSNQDERIKVIHKVNGGLSDARNAGLKESTGDFITFIDSDDYAEIYLIDEVLHTAKDNKSEVVIYGYFADIVDSEEKLIDSNLVLPNFGNYNLNNINKITIDETLINLLGYAWNKMYRAEIILENNFEFNKGISLVEDVLFNVPIFKKTQKISFLNKAYIHYIQRDRDTLGTKLYDNYNELKHMSAEAIKELMFYWNKPDNEVKQIYNKLIFDSMKNLLVTLGSKKSLSLNKRENYFRSMIDCNDTKKAISSVETKSRKDQLIKQLLLNKRYKVLLIGYQLRANKL